MIIEKLADKIGASSLPTYGWGEGSGRPELKWIRMAITI